MRRKVHPSHMDEFSEERLYTLIRKYDESGLVELKDAAVKKLRNLLKKPK